MSVSTSGWIKGISLSVVATIIGGASKLAIRKSWLMSDSSEREHVMSSEETNYGSASDDSVENSTAEIQNTDKSDRRQLAALMLRLAGMIGMTFLNPLCGVLAMNYASPSITAPFSGLTLVWIVIFSETFVGERPSFMQIVASSLIVMGEVVVAVFGDHTNDDGVTLTDLEASYREPAFISFFVVMFIWMIIIAYWIRYSESSTLKRFAWGVAGGSVTGIQNFLKDGLTILKAKEGLPWYFSLFLANSIAASFGGLLLLTACMKRYDATYSSAMFVGSYVIIVSIMSATHYNTFQNLSGIINYILYPSGLIILMIGVWILVRETKKPAYSTGEAIYNTGEANGGPNSHPLIDQES